MILQAPRNPLTQGDITELYAEVYIHLKEKNNSSFIKANKVILAFHSPYFHRIFQSRDNMQSVDFVFIGVGADVIRETISMMYGRTLNVSINEIAKFKMFFKMLEMDFGLSENVDNPATTNKRPSTVECEPTDMDIGTEMSSPSHGNSSPRRKKALQPTSSTYDEDKTTTATKAQQPIATKQTHLQSSRKTFDSPAIQPSNTTKQLPEPSKGTSRKSIEKDTPEESKETGQESRQSASAYKTTGCWYTSRVGAPASLNNWTETTEEGLQDRLEEIEFKLGLTSEGHHKDYKCCNCEKIFKAFSLALNHFEEVHKKCDEEISLLREAMEYRKEAVENIGKLQTQIVEGCLKELADNQLR